MSTLFVTVLVASLLGSLHCAGMCGAFLVFATGGHDPKRRSPQVRLQSAYHLGRLITYTLLGVTAGVTGSLIDLTARLAGLSTVASVLAGGLIVVFGSLTLARQLGWKAPKLGPPARLQKWVASGQRAAMAQDPLPRAFTIGLLTTLLPCGWLYAFAIVAAGTASPWLGGGVMGAFWLGTLPALVAVGAGVNQLVTRLSPALGRAVPVLTCVAMIGVGLATVLGRASLSPEALAQTTTPEQPACCTEP